VWEVLGAAAVIAWRFRSHPLNTLWRDWVVILCLFWIFTALAGRTKAWPAVTALVMTFLLAIYAAGQVPQTLAVLRSF